ncbi:MAG: lactate utilization protein [Candidatus Binataceae bacterium]|jgi:L-lactate dehydrogenase complex protein LldG
MSEFQKLLADVKTALEHGAAERPHPVEDAAAAVPMTHVARRAALGSKFVRELTAVAGQVIEVGSAGDAVKEIVELARRTGARSAVSGEPLDTGLSRIDAELQRLGVEVICTGPVAKDDFAPMRARIARADLGIIEADYAIAATGTIAVIANATRPRSVSLLPPTSVFILHIDRIVSDLAALMRTIGPEKVSDNPLVLITGPSRTADIEKRIVLGVHGPKDLYVVLIWPKDE